MAEERDAANGTEEPGDGPLYPQAPRGGPADWNDLGQSPQWPQSWPGANDADITSGADATAPFRSDAFKPSGQQSAVGAAWGTSAPPTSPDDTWHDDTWRGNTVPSAEAYASPESDRRRRRSLGMDGGSGGGGGCGRRGRRRHCAGGQQQRRPGASKSGALPHAAGNTPLSSNAQSLNVHSIASHVAPATVDITAKGANGQDEGTGMIITSSGVVLTNNHVIDGSTQSDGTS